MKRQIEGYVPEDKLNTNNPPKGNKAAIDKLSDSGAHRAFDPDDPAPPEYGGSIALGISLLCLIAAAIITIIILC